MSHHRSEESPEENSQVRNIIRQLNEDSPSKEKEREVVVRPDGSKVVRVTKKRRALVSKEEQGRNGRKFFMQSLFVFFLLLASVAGFFFYRMTSMSGERYLMSRGQELQQYWGASSVKCTGAVIDGINFYISNIVAEFPEGSMLERVELSGVESELDLGSFFTGILSGGDLKIAKAHVYLRPDARRLQLPQAQGDNLWRFLRVSCPDFSISFAGEGSSPWSILHSNAYMYHPSVSRSLSERSSERSASAGPLTVVTLDGGTMQMRGWKTIALRTAKLHFSQLAIEDFNLSGTTDGDTSTTESTKSSIAFSGSIADGGALSGPYYFVADNMNLTEFTEGRFNHFFAARTVRPNQRSGVPSTQMHLPLDRSFPQFMGTFHLKEVSVSGFPALHVIVEHLEPAKRKRYMPPTILFAKAKLMHEDGAMTLSFDETDMTERDVITLRGELRVDESRELSGTLDYGIPSVLTYAEYRDGKADPLFRDSGNLAWVSTKVFGAAAHPQDDSHELDAAAAADRSERERLPFEDIDLERVNEFFKSRDQLLHQSFNPQGGTDVPQLNTTTTSEGGEAGDSRLTPGGSLSPTDSLAPSGQHELDSPF